MRALRLLGVLLATFSLTACLESTTLVKLKPDGSGTVEQTTLMNMAAVKGMMGGANAQAKPGPMMNKADLERTAARMGKGVRLVSTEEVKGANGFEGTKAIFSFDDINQVQISQDPNLSGGTDPKVAAEPKQDDPVKFKLTRNNSGTSTLTINFADRPAGRNARPHQPDDDEHDQDHVPGLQDQHRSRSGGVDRQDQRRVREGIAPDAARDGHG